MTDPLPHRCPPARYIRDQPEYEPRDAFSSAGPRPALVERAAQGWERFLRGTRPDNGQEGRPSSGAEDLCGHRPDPLGCRQLRDIASGTEGEPMAVVAEKIPDFEGVLMTVPRAFVLPLRTSPTNVEVLG
ncbi:hypothetical protein ACFWWM_25805 [Streptomyces sp. NPDC058682]|uniref:hypothetical protein n=1 Tax=unclassified Streptomyces TaxID=2593676 RepID=UPI0022569727|nr:hypothetical protein [Streptomyces sp. NBC_01214]MCX4804605.1 hypothetical protein [Streptomyces sp. NBC_01214]